MATIPAVKLDVIEPDEHPHLLLTILGCEARNLSPRAATKKLHEIISISYDPALEELAQAATCLFVEGGKIDRKDFDHYFGTLVSRLKTIRDRHFHENFSRFRSPSYESFLQRTPRVR